MSDEEDVTKQFSLKSLSDDDKDELLDIAQDILEDDMDTTEGICLNCKSTQSGCEPDARNYTCEGCDMKAVFGAQEVLIMFAI